MLSLSFRSVVRTAAALALLACVGVLTAQGRQAAPRSTDQMLRERQRMIYKRALEDELRRRPRTREEQRLAVEQIKEDYVRIQVVSGDLTRMADEEGGPDLKLVAKSAAEIRKRAERLRSNLALPESGGDAGHAAAGEKRGEIKASLTTLGELVKRFVRNPIFREINVVDAQASARASLDLEEIIELSGKLKKECERSDRDSR